MKGSVPPTDKVLSTKQMIEDMRARFANPPKPDGEIVDRRLYKKVAPSKTSDLGSDYRTQHGGAYLETSELSGGGVPIADRRRVKAECGIEALFMRAQINDRQFQAGIRFRALWARAAMPAQMTSSYGQQRGGGGGREEEIDARLQVQKALLGAKIAIRQKSAQALKLTTTGESLKPVGGGVVVTKAGAAVIEAAGMDGRDYRLEDLRAGLTALADFWHITDDANL
ncbi:hypothetical protein [Azospirillum canadense]|uniref:hypothetical protein n=1 Tax=Azospirillum canadense TaxID=403962 RepID=UPI002227C7DD|nr:hypothetical protein [Azospirillum canadense]MCW2242216.1 hypothetical protein [Azospirillum canadense]